MKPLLSSVLTTFCLLVAFTVHAETLSVVTLYSPPLAYEQNGKVIGLAADMVREGLKRMGYEADISIVPWKRAVFMTRFGEADAIFYAVKKPEREAWFHYPDEPLVQETTVLMKRIGNNFGWTSEQRDFSGLRLGVGRGYYYGPKLKRFLEDTSFKVVEEATSFDLNFAKLAEGRLDIFLADLHVAEYFMRENSVRDVAEIVTNADGIPYVLDSVNSYLAFSRRTMSLEVTEKFSETLKGMRQEGVTEQIIKKYR